MSGHYVSRASITAAAGQQRTAAFGAPMSGGGSIGTTGYTSIYAPIVSRDFLEIPQDLDVRWAWYRHFYRFNSLVNRAIDLHSTLPISRISLKAPKSEDKARGHYVRAFFERLVSRIGLLSHLIASTREYNVTGNAFLYAQDDEDTLVHGSDSPDDPYADYPDDDFARVTDPDPEVGERDATPEERLLLKRAWYDERFGKRNPDYLGWTRVVLLPVEHVRVRTVEASDEAEYQYIPGVGGHSHVNRPYTMRDDRGSVLDPTRADDGIPPGIYDLYEDAVGPGTTRPVGLPSDPYSGSAVCHLARNAADFDDLGRSALDPALMPLIHKDKIRQLNATIINRNMTPIRVITAPELSSRDLDDLRSQVDAAINTPDFSVVTNYEMQWEDKGADNRLLDAANLNEGLDREIMMALKVSEGLLTGDNTYGGNRIAAEMMNVEYLQFRETVLEWYIEEFLFKPVAWKRGFIEVDEFGDEVLLYPRVRFARLGVRDNDQLYDQMFNLYLKGSLPLSVVLDMMNVDVDEAEDGVKEDMLTVRDPKFTDMWGRVMEELAGKLVEGSDLVARLVEYLQVEAPEPEAAPEAPEDAQAGRWGTPRARLAAVARRARASRPLDHLAQRASAAAAS